MSPPAATLADQQRTFDAFRRVYNEERPHEVLGQCPAGLLLRPVAAPLPAAKSQAPNTAMASKSGRCGNGEIKRARERVFVSEALVGEPVGLVRHDDRSWAIRFGHLEIGLLDGQSMRIIKTPSERHLCIRASVTYVSGRSEQRSAPLWRRPRKLAQAPHYPARKSSAREARISGERGEDAS